MTRINGMKKGFSLVELAISIIIIALLIAGISSGSKLIEQAEMRAFISEMQDWRRDFQQFKEVYNAKPGDFRSASSFFSNCASGGAGNINCNGNGNGLIEIDNAAAAQYPGVDFGGEMRRVFRHLNLSGINTVGGKAAIPSNFSFTNIASTSNDYPKLSNGRTIAITSTSNTIGDGITMNVSTPFSGTSTQGGFVLLDKNPQPGSISPLKAFQIDQKIDDGAYVGSQAFGATTGDFGATIDPTGSAVCQTGGMYAVTSTTDLCIPVYKME